MNTRQMAGAATLTGVAVLAVALLGAGFAPAARSQINAAPTFQPVGVSASGATSTVWFYEPSSRQTLACQTLNETGKGLSAIQCVSTRLP